MRFGLLIQGAPHAGVAGETALGFAAAAAQAGHEVRLVFFHKDAAAIANHLAKDERGTRGKWLDFSKRHGAELVVCVASAARRGVVEGQSLAPGFQLGGLGQLVATMAEADRLVSF